MKYSRVSAAAQLMLTLSCTILALLESTSGERRQTGNENVPATSQNNTINSNSRLNKNDFRLKIPQLTTSSVSVSNIQTRSINTSNSSNLEATGRSNSNSGGKFEFVEDELPADFYEMPPEQLDLGMNATGRAPIPILNVAVLQNSQVIDSAINVHPGTPLEMVIYLDDKSAKVYGLLASYLKVQDDTFRQREEVIILNGCSLDTYIFGNFETDPEDQSLRAKFRAFKFPDSNFVRFVGTVNVCIKQCAKVDCNGRRQKRGVGQDERLVLTVSTVLRIGKPASLQGRPR